MTVIRRNLIANLAGQGWIALMSFLFVPFYLKFIGAEGYGLVGFFVLLSSTLALLDFGMSATATRELASFADADAEGKRRIVTLVRTIEALFWAVAILIGMVVGLAAPLIARYWLNADGQHISDVTANLRLMAAALVVQFPVAFYSACLIGLQDQLKLNAINIVSATARGIGAVLVLWWIMPTVYAFFVWQVVIGFATVVWLAVSLRPVTGAAGAARSWFDLSAVSAVATFTAHAGGINMLGFLLTQVDKIILSKVLPLKTFGYYTLAWTLGTFAFRLILPIFNAYYPRITQLVAEQKDIRVTDLHLNEELLKVYLKACRVMAIAIVPFSVWLAFFSKDLLFMWTRDLTVAEESSSALALIALGTMFNGFMHIPYGLQLASGKTGLALWQNFVALLLVVPLTYYLATQYGLTGAAVPWLLLNIGYVTVSAQLMYRIIMGGARWRWYRSAVLVPIIQATCLVGSSYYATTYISGRVLMVFVMFVGLVVSVGFSVWHSGFLKRNSGFLVG
jgi:O-antigen/teichoic acid export membrane protein